jgi:hypothetical protein
MAELSPIQRPLAAKYSNFSIENILRLSRLPLAFPQRETTPGPAVHCGQADLHPCPLIEISSGPVTLNSDSDPVTLNRESGLVTEGRDSSLLILNRDLGFVTPDRDSAPVIPDSGPLTPGKESGLVTPGRDSGQVSPNRDSVLPTPRRDFGPVTPRKARLLVSNRKAAQATAASGLSAYSSQSAPLSVDRSADLVSSGPASDLGTTGSGWMRPCRPLQGLPTASSGLLVSSSCPSLAQSGAGALTAHRFLLAESSSRFRGYIIFSKSSPFPPPLKQKFWVPLL